MLESSALIFSVLRSVSLCFAIMCTVEQMQDDAYRRAAGFYKVK